MDGLTSGIVVLLSSSTENIISARNIVQWQGGHDTFGPTTGAIIGSKVRGHAEIAVAVVKVAGRVGRVAASSGPAHGKRVVGVAVFECFLLKELVETSCEWIDRIVFGKILRGDYRGTHWYCIIVEEF